MEEGIETEHDYSLRQPPVLVIDLSVTPHPLVWTLNLTSVTDETSTDDERRRVPRR